MQSALDTFVRAEGQPEVVMFSGGEPTIHPQILDFIRLANQKGIGLVTLNTSGIRLAHDRRFVAELAAVDPNPRIYLQFDGLEERTHREIRGRDLRATKQQALDHCAEAGLVVILVAAIERGWFAVSDFVPVPCCFPTCRSITYALVDGDNVVPVTRLLNVEDYLDYLSNRVMPDASIRQALEKLWSASAFAGSPLTDARRPRPR